MTAILPTNRHLSHYSAELVRRCEARQMCTATMAAAAILGAAVDAGIVTLDDLLCLVRSCSTTDELGDALTMLAASAQLQPEGGAR